MRPAGDTRSRPRGARGAEAIEPPDHDAAPASAVGSALDAAAERRAARKPWRRIRHLVSWHLVGLAAAVVPWLYFAYCWFVWRTSVVIDETGPTLEAALQRHGRVVGVLWHQEVFTVAYAYQRLRPHTLASLGNFGRIITRMLERCGFLVFRGGSSAGTARRRRVLPDMIRHMETWPGRVLYGITVDGSNGPPWVMKSGALVIARACRAPVYVNRTSFSRSLQVPTWDRTVFPLPFGRIVSRSVGPYWIDPDASDEELERFRAHVNDELLDLTHAIGQDLAPGSPPPVGYPADFRPRWPADAATSPRAAGLALGPHDLRPLDPPAWASAPGAPS